ncbi:MAG TPA: homeobox protein YbgS [Erwinia persicina]|uniref:YbgS-like family protein n=1 Tax=Erwinia persicina TaxID=55211 RepID=UPI000787166F|nr:YbgS-like family protein [Erwinia persicina]AXU95920.1 homeobox protein YbgS [Erwinia persicina]MBC3945398.1 YbgS-like family protein [Erwinia persicina]MBD8166487.1 YbgS-like family protein [Erwinia persicina]MCQ4093114.1 YbgS-like family protein [Erwinia persicina]MCQ4100279.1 YbgS-like family protein [Erwinia persicina]
MMNKFAIVFLTAAMTLGSGAAMAAGDGNGSANAAADAGAVAPGAKENLPPNKVDNSKINTSGDNATHKDMKNHNGMSADEVNKNAQCKDGKCPDINSKVGDGADTKTDGTTQ